MRFPTVLKQVGVPVVLGTLLLAAGAPLQAAERMSSGQWESAMTTDGATRSVKFCIDAAEAASNNGDSKAGREFAENKARKAGGRCTVDKYDIKGETIAYTLLCGNRSISSTQAYRGDTAEGVLSTTVQGKATTTTQIKSRRLGSCP